ncbi:shikimate dehydrogenase [Morganella psychrotolerans]|uniref:Shikimate dehydrogenase (NADP(+)) n=1 Tax=Morganella psychrotolerans TaxID=368603 RepID=A0A5M9QVM2_9GAMM|nr:shikimate dehydrogenase [Morganella psychrotolerans]KAA8712418.1 shikimate dehydrogenase [Morganella psychrotolerans]OBU06526.1 shikimate dehydrogenase [Morganella psychrotolerans]
MKKFVVFGHPIAHSQSPFIHQEFAKQFGIELSYERILSPLAGFRDCVSAFFADGGLGANVTLPFKEQAYALSDELSERAQICGAVNTLHLKEDNRIFGDNTDGEGLVIDLQRLNFIRPGEKILLIGAGGAARGALLPLLRAGGTITVTNRTLTKAQSLAEQFSVYGDVRAVATDKTDTTGFSLIINATSSGVDGGVPQIPVSLLNNTVACYDMFYRTGLTPFLQLAVDNGVVRYADGLGMLAGQAAFAFKLWHGVLPDIAPVLAQLKQRMT